jgi:hypothetical protein
MYGNTHMLADIMQQVPEIPKHGTSFAELGFLQLRERFAQFTERIEILKVEKERLGFSLNQTKVERSVMVGSPSNPFGRSGLLGLVSGRDTKEWREKTRKPLDSQIKTLETDIWVKKNEIRILEDYLDELTARMATKVDEQGAAPISDDPPDYPADECPPTYSEATAN